MIVMLCGLEALKLAQAKRGIIESGIDIRNELSGIKDIDMTAIQDAIKNDKLNIIKAQIDALTKMKNEILALSNIENPLEVAKQFSMQDAITVNGKIQEFFNRYSWDFDSDTNLDKGNAGTPILKTAQEVKVVFDGYHLMSDPSFGITAAHYFIQPCDTGDKKRNEEIIRLCVEFIKNNPQWKLSLQTQKILKVR